MKQFIRYLWGTIARPRTTFDALAEEHTVRWGIAASFLGVFQVWGNMALHAAFGQDWLGTRELLADPTLVAGFGHWRVNLADYIPVLAVLMPFLALLGLVATSGIAHLLGKLWGGQGTFEQMVNMLAFASAVPTIVIGAATEWIFGVPIDLLTGHRYWWTAAMQGEFGTISAIWNVYFWGVYLGLQYTWIIVLESIAIRRVQRIPPWAAVTTALAVFSVSMFLWSVFIR
jgi:hypothetical protein